ncbi:MAG TPA: AraC family ligand binding domain-containing protein [Gaiellaceae bacterium]|nr:AraC family ligand binding domain-containing protein [Gaiellaceae bacterium]
MPKASKETASESERFEGVVEERRERLDGYTVEFTTFLGDLDGAPMLKGLPDDQCQCPHWGYVFEGTLTFRFSDREERFEAGDAFYVPPGHVPEMRAGTEVVWFHPTEELEQTMAAIRANMGAAGAGA